MKRKIKRKTPPDASADGRGGDGFPSQSPQHSDPELSAEPQLAAFKAIAEQFTPPGYTITIDQVKRFIVVRGRGHIVASTDERWTRTICGSLIVGGELMNSKPRRICSKCREALKTARPNPQP